MINLEELNDNQRAAVEWEHGPLLVLAGPGSGKTKVLTTRIAKILERSAGQHFHILALTFTNKAAGEMSERVERLIPQELPRVRLTTFHSYAAEILQQHGSYAGIRPDFRILASDAERIAVLQDVLNDLRRSQAVVFPSEFSAERLLPLINNLLERCISVDDVQKVLESNRIQESVTLATIYKSYRAFLRRQNCLDFPSLIIEALELLRHYPGIPKFIRRVYKHILVDEFQDTNRSQYELLSLIIKPDPSTLFAVADDDQIIYQWNGASPKRLQELRDDFGAAEIQLPENYRCPSDVILLANRLISHNLNRITKIPLIAMKKRADDSNVVRVISFLDFEDESSWVLNDILMKNVEERRKCAILARTKKVLDEVYEKLTSNGVPVYMGVRKDEFQSAPLLLLHSILKLTSSKINKSLLSTLCASFKAITNTTVDVTRVITKVETTDGDMLHAWCDELLSVATAHEDVRSFCNGLLSFLRSSQYETFAEFIFQWYETIVEQMKSGVEQDFDAVYEEEKKAWRSLVADINRHYIGEKISLYQFAQELDLRSKTLPQSADSIPCFTIHASKGMEFGHVYLMGMVDGQLPSWAATKKGAFSQEIQEERRDCFVAITRAQESLTLTYSKSMWGWSKRPSRFLEEMGIHV